MQDRLLGSLRLPRRAHVKPGGPKDTCMNQDCAHCTSYATKLTAGRSPKEFRAKGVGLRFRVRAAGFRALGSGLYPRINLTKGSL